jgi:hypothetical protein
VSDPRTVRLVALLIGLTALASVLGTIVLLTQGKEADAALAGLAGTALGYLAGVLTPASGSTPQAVTVQQDPADPIPTTDVGAISVVEGCLILLFLLVVLLVLGVLPTR